MSDKAIMATVWLDGCSGCHMSFLDIDERICKLQKKQIWFTVRWLILKSSQKWQMSPSLRVLSAAKKI